VSGLSSLKNFKNWATGCREIAYCLLGYFIFSHPVRWLGKGYERKPITFGVDYFAMLL